MTYVRSFTRGVAAVVGLTLVVVTAIAARIRRQRIVPTLVWGPTPILNIKYLSEAAKIAGYRSTTVVDDVYAINEASDFDHPIPRSILGTRTLRPLAPYLVLATALWRFDVFHFFFDGGFLRSTPLRFLECQLLALAGKRIVVMPYGSDIAMPSRIDNRPFAEALVHDYPLSAESERIVERQVLYFSWWADFVIGCGIQPGFCPRVDLLLANYIAIDTALWHPAEKERQGDGHGAEVVIVHAPNHRSLKGTSYLLEAIDGLQREGLDVRLELLEGKRNDEVRHIMRDSDVVAEQFLVGYALNAIEGMSLAKPVLSNLEVHAPELIERTSLSECPIVSVSPEGLKEKLRWLVEHPDERERLGRAGRCYVQKWHSLEAMATTLDGIYRQIWPGPSEARTRWRSRHARTA